MVPSKLGLRACLYGTVSVTCSNAQVCCSPANLRTEIRTVALLWHQPDSAYLTITAEELLLLEQTQLLPLSLTAAVH